MSQPWDSGALVTLLGMAQITETDCDHDEEEQRGTWASDGRPGSLLLAALLRRSLQEAGKGESRNDRDPVRGL